MEMPGMIYQPEKYRISGDICLLLFLRAGLEQ
jgi:hypothetical protein